MADFDEVLELFIEEPRDGWQIVTDEAQDRDRSVERSADFEGGGSVTSYISLAQEGLVLQCCLLVHPEVVKKSSPNLQEVLVEIMNSSPVLPPAVPCVRWLYVPDVGIIQGRYDWYLVDEVWNALPSASVMNLAQGLMRRIEEYAMLVLGFIEHVARSEKDQWTYAELAKGFEETNKLLEYVGEA